MKLKYTKFRYIYLAVLFLCAGIVYAGGKKQKDAPFIPAEVDPYHLPRIGVAPFIAPNNVAYLVQDTRALHEKVTGYLIASGRFFVEDNEYVKALLKENGLSPRTLYQQPVIMRLRDLPSNTLNYIVFGELEIVDGQYKVTLRLLDLDKAIFTVTRAAVFRPNGRDVAYGISELSAQFIKAIDTSGFILKNKVNVIAGPEYEVGDRGPGGGLIFFKKGNAKDGWRYLELSPPSAEFTAPWGFLENGVYGPDGFITDTGLGAGRLNTLTIIARMDAARRTGSAAQIIRRLSVGGCDDWYIPSKDELELAWSALGSKGLGGFSREPYWSSSQSDYPYVWFVDFRDGRLYFNGNKPHLMRVRAIRAF